MEIKPSDFAEDCVRQGVNVGANPHYLLGVAKLRSGIADGTVGAEIGPFRLTQADWNAHCTDSAFGLTFLPTDITDPDMQIPVFAVMARRAFDAFEAANNRTPSAKELYLRQFPNAPAETLSADLKAALDATAALIDPAAAAVLDDEQTPKITDPDQPVPGGVARPTGSSESEAGVSDGTAEATGRRPTSASPETDAAIVDAAKKFGFDPNTFRAIASIESSMDPESNRNRTTQYKGLFQIGRDEWAQFGSGGDIFSARDNAMAFGRMTRAHVEQFRSHFGRDPTDTELYLIHQQGLGFYTRGVMTNIAGNPYPGMQGPQTHESFEAGWGRELMRRKVWFAGGRA